MVSKEKCNECKKEVERKEVIKHHDHDEIVLTCGHKYRFFRRNITEHIISNVYVERDMTDNFLCVLYFRGQSESDVKNNGMNPCRRSGLKGGLCLSSPSLYAIPT